MSGFFDSFLDEVIDAARERPSKEETPCVYRVGDVVKHIMGSVHLILGIEGSRVWLTGIYRPLMIKRIKCLATVEETLEEMVARDLAHKVDGEVFSGPEGKPGYALPSLIRRALAEAEEDGEKHPAIPWLRFLMEHG